MFNVCPNCGMYEVDKLIQVQAQQATATCSHCNHAHLVLENDTLPWDKIDGKEFKEMLLRISKLGHYWTSQSEFNEWFKTHHAKVQPNIDLIDTTNLSVEFTLERTIKWFRDKIKSSD